MIDSAWIIVAILVLVIFVSIWLVKKKQSAATFLATAVMVLLVTSISYIYISNQVPLTPQGLIDGAKIYISWVISAGKNVVDVTSYVIHKDWSSNNSTSYPG